jgi:HK97 family phage portal protein
MYQGQKRIRRVQTRARYARTPNNFLVNDPDGFPSDYSPVMWWMGLDSGGGSYPIGPNGPWSTAGPSLPVVVRATALITGPLTAAPFRVLELGFGGRPLGRPRWVTDPMTLREDGRFPVSSYPAVATLPRSLFWASWIRSAIWWGAGAFITNLDETGQPLAGTLRLVDPAVLTTERAGEDNSLRWVLDTGDTERVVFDRDGFITIGEIRYKIVVLRNPHSPVDSEGHSMGVFEMAPGAFRLAGQIASYASGTFRSGVPAGYLKVETPGFQQEQADELKAKWLAAHGGDRRSIAVLNAVTSFVPLSLSPVDAALGEVTRLNVAEVAMAFGLDPMTLGAGMNNSATYTNLRDAWDNHRDFGLAPWQSGVEDTLTALLPGTQGIKCDLDRFANPTFKERMEGYTTGIEAGVITKDEARENEGLPPLPPGEEDDQTRAVSQQEAVQKVYLGVTNGVISVPEARQMINDAGGHLVVDDVPGTEVVPEEDGQPETRERRQPWR